MKVITTPLNHLLLVETSPLETGEPESVEIIAAQPLKEAGLHCGNDRLLAHRFASRCISPLCYAQTKKPRLISVVDGQGWAVAVDLRRNSNTFTRYYGVELSFVAGLSMLLPAGFAFGIANRQDTPLTLVEMSERPLQSYLFNPLDEGLAIRWPDGLALCPVKKPLLQVQDGIRNHLFMEM